jgi:peptidoglycan hydrolase-like protein with peptidoglycan-binding domain
VFADSVAQSQRMLNQLGYNAGPVDGAYGGKTKRALEAFYAKNGGSFDGKLDTNEIIDLKNAIKEIKTNNGKHKKILSERYSIYPDWCTYENKYAFKRIENLLGNKNYDLKTIEVH